MNVKALSSRSAKTHAAMEKVQAALSDDDLRNRFNAVGNQIRAEILANLDLQKMSDEQCGQVGQEYFDKLIPAFMTVLEGQDITEEELRLTLKLLKESL